MRIVLLEGSQVLRDLTFDNSPITIGSDASSGVHLPDLSIALEHARLTLSHTGQWQLEASCPSARTLINDRELDKRCPVYNGDEIAISRFRLKVAVSLDCDLGVAGPSSLDELARIKGFPLPPGGEVRQVHAPLVIPPDRQRFLAGFAQELGGCNRVAELMDRTLAALQVLFGPRLAWFGCRLQPAGPLETVAGRTPDGPSNREPQALASLEYRCLERRQSLLLARKRSRNQESGLAVPLEAKRGCLGLLYVEASPTEHRYKAGHLDLLLAAASHAAARLEDILVSAVQAEQAKGAQANGVEAKGGQAKAPAAGGGENWVRAIQARLDPRRVPSWPGYELAVYRRPGAVPGGDLYDAMTMPNKMGSMLVANVQADPTGAAIALAEVQAAFRVAGLHADPPRILLQELDWLINAQGGGGRLCAAHVVINPKTGAMEFSTAGPAGALIISSRDAARTLTDPAVARLGSGQAAPFPRRTERLGAGETLVLYTPSCGNMRSADGRELGHDRFVEALRGGAGLPPSELLDDLQHDLAEFFRDGRREDDITVLLLSRR